MSPSRDGDRAGAVPPPGREPAPGERMRLGGMALRNGLLVHGPTAWAAAARAPDGSIEVASGQKPRAPSRLASLPLLRGPLRLGEGLAFIPLARRRLPAARLPLEDGMVVAAALTAALLGAALRRLPLTPMVREGAAGALGLMPALIALRDSDLAAYHGVEHKAIGAYERGVEPEVVAKEHERCGSHLIAPMLALSIAGQLLLERVSARPGRIARSAAGIASVSAAVELFAWSERHPDSAFGRAFHAPGTEIQRLLATREPTREQLEVGSAAMREILRAEAAARA